jgi:hypothetical protein
LAAEKPSEELTNATNIIECGLPFSREDCLIIEYVSKISTERRDRYHGTVDLSVKPPCPSSAYLYPNRRNRAHHPTAHIAK